MAARLEIPNFSKLNIKQQTLLNADASAGATSITPQNVSGFATNDLVYLGNLGKDQIEKQEITIAGANFTVSALQYQHDRFEPITSVYGDQIQVYVAADPGTGYAPVDANFATLGSLVTIDPTSKTSTYIDSGGGSGFWYKYVYWNSVTNAATSYLSDVDPVRGGNVGFYVSVDAVRKAAGFANNKNISDSYIAGFISMANDYINGRLVGLYALPFLSPIPPTIVNIAKQYATGLMLQDQYGNFAQGSQADGDAKIQDADVALTEIADFENELRDQSGQSLRIFQPIAGWPDNTTWNTPGAADDGTPQFGGQQINGNNSPMMPITKVF